MKIRTAMVSSTRMRLILTRMEFLMTVMMMTTMTVSKIIRTTITITMGLLISTSMIITETAFLMTVKEDIMQASMNDNRDIQQFIA